MLYTPHAGGLRVFCSYSHKDEDMKEHLRKHLSPLIRAKEISEFWHFRKIPPGREVNREILCQLERAQIILLLLSHNFFDSDYCWRIETEFAVQQHRAMKAIVIPIILTPIFWEVPPLHDLQALPRDGSSIKQSKNIDLAMKNVAKGVYSVLSDARKNPIFAVEEQSQSAEFSCSISANQVRSIRPSGLSELIDDIIFRFRGDPGENRVTNISVMFNTNLTSRLIYDPCSEATLSVASTESAACLPTLSRPIHARNTGGNALAFFNVPLHELRLLPEGQRNLRLSNIRVNASQVVTASVKAPITMFVSSSPHINVASPQIDVGQVCDPVQVIFTVASRGANPIAGLRFRQSQSENSAVLNEPPSSARFNSFITFRGKLCDHESFPGQRTNVMLRFAGIPLGVTVFASTSEICSEPSPLHLRMVDSDANGNTDPSARTFIDGEAVLNDRLYPTSRVPIVEGAGVAVWELGGGALEASQSVTIGLVLAFIANPQRNCPGIGTASVTGCLAPLSTVVTQSSKASTPRFADYPVTLEFFTVVQ